MPSFIYDFEWDPRKAKINARKHGVDFEQAAEVFQDPLAVAIPDDEHTTSESRWITLGKGARARYLVVVHTFEELDEKTARVRIISARRPTRNEIREYEEQP